MTERAVGSYLLSMSRRFDRFITALAHAESREDLANPWSIRHGSNANRIRRANLRRYLGRLDAAGTRTMFVGEALGHRGGRISGVPFTSLSLLLEGTHPLLGRSSGYDDPGDAGAIRREASATMIWEAINRMAEPPLLWNAFPFHPHRLGDPRSNRSPRSSEIELGKRYLTELAQLFSIESFVAVGRVGSRALERLGIEHVYVRHPSVGGKRLFENGLEAHSITCRDRMR